MATQDRRRSASAKSTKRGAAKKSATGRKAAGGRKQAPRSTKGGGRGASAGARGGRAAKKTTAARGRKSTGRAAGGRGGGRSMNAVTLLKDDHQRVQEMFDRFERARSDDQKQKLAETICQELTVHAQIEEEIFYPAVREAIRDTDLIDEAEVEHDSAKALIAQIQGESNRDEKWEAKVKVLGEYVKHHVKEEQNEMFPKARQAKLDLKALGEQLAARKQALMSGEAPMGGGRGGSGRSGRAGGGRSGESRGGESRGGEGSEGERNEEPGFLETAVRSLMPGGSSSGSSGG